MPPGLLPSRHEGLWSPANKKGRDQAVCVTCDGFLFLIGIQGPGFGAVSFPCEVAELGHGGLLTASGKRTGW